MASRKFSIRNQLIGDRVATIPSRSLQRKELPKEALLRQENARTNFTAKQKDRLKARIRALRPSVR